MNRRANVRFLPIAIVLGATAVAAMVLAQTNKRPAPAAASPNPSPTSGTTTATPGVEVVPAERKPLTYYTGRVRGDLFIMSVPPAAELKPKAEPSKKVVASGLPPPAAPVNPLADYAYTGTVTMGGQWMALVENIKTKEGQYLKEGDPFLGGVITGINARMLTVRIAGADRMLAKTENFRLTPLDKSAPYLQGGGQSNQPGQPGEQPQPGQPTPAKPPQAIPVGVMPPEMQNLPPEVQARIMDLMKRMETEGSDTVVSPVEEEDSQ